MGLDLVDLLKFDLAGAGLLHFEDEHGAGFVCLSDTCKQCFSVARHLELGDGCSDLEWLLVHVIVPNSVVVASHEHLEGPVWNWSDRRHLDSFESEVLISDLLTSFLGVNKIPEVGVTTLA
jgi:hypothetical protein